MTAGEPGRSAVWTRYWASGRAHSCPGTVDDRLTGGFADFWRPLFAALGEHDRVLEVGCGNAAVSRLALEGAPEGHVPQVDAVDLARPRPAWPEQLAPERRARFRLHGDTPLERLPFPDASFSLVVGQYAFEYAERGRALREVGRCSALGASLALVLHHANSAVVRTAVAEREQLRWLTGPEGLYVAVGDLLPDLARARDPAEIARLQQDPSAERHRRRYNELQDAVQRRAAGSPAAELLDEAAQAAATVAESALREGETAARALLARQSQAFADLDLRLEELVGCALDEARLAELVAQLEGSGYNGVETGRLRERGHLMGWTLVAKRQDR